MEKGLGHVGRRHSLLSDCDLDRLLVGSGLGLDPRRVALQENEQAPLRAGMFERDRHQDFDEPVENDLAGYGLRGLDHRLNVQLLDGRAGRGGGAARRLLAQMRVGLVHLPDFSVGAPPEIAVSSVPQIGMGDRLEAARRVEIRGKLVGETPRSGRSRARAADRMACFVQALGVQLRPVEARNLGANERRPVREVFGAVLRPESRATGDVPLAPPICAGRSSAAHPYRRPPREQSPRRNGIQPIQIASVLSRAVARLSFPPRQRTRSRPSKCTPATCVSNTSTRQSPAEDLSPNAARSRLLVELRVVGECEVQRTSTKNPNEPQLRDRDVDYETEPHPANDLEPILRLSLHVAEQISGAEKVRDQVDAAIGCIGKVAGAQRRVEGAPQEGAA